MIEVIRQKDDLNREVWKFWPNTSPHRVYLMLDEYSVQARQTTRHKWQPVAKYERLGRRPYDDKFRQIKLDDVPAFPADVEAEVMAKFMATVEIKRER